MRRFLTTATTLWLGFHAFDVDAQTSNQVLVPANNLAADPYEPTAADREWDAWSQALWCELIEHPTPLVRLRAHYVLQLRKEGASAIDCDSPLPGQSEFRRQALLSDSKNPALIANVYRLECASRLPANWCRDADLREKLVALDPDNAYPHLLYLERGGSTQRASSLTFSGAELEHLLAAASSRTLDSYWALGMPEAYEALEAAIADRPANDWTAGTLEEFADIGIDLNNPEDIAGFATMALMSLDLALGSYSLINIATACQAARSAGDSIAVEGCQALGKLAEREARTLAGQSVGRALQGQRRGDGADPPDWHRDIDTLVSSCEMPRGMIASDGLPGSMPVGETLQWLQETVELGEGPANRRKAQREYALYPKAFPMNPANCEAIRSLPVDEQETLAARWRNSTGEGRTEAALKRAATMLD